MAEKKIIWKQKTGAGTFDILYPQTTADQVKYNDSTVAEALANIGTNLADKYVTLDTNQTISATKTFSASKTGNFIEIKIAPYAGGELSPQSTGFGLSLNSGGIVTDYRGDKIVHSDTANEIATHEYKFPTQSGTLLVDGDIPDISIINSGSGNAITAITATEHTITVTKGETFATTDIATDSSDGLMSSTDKKNLDTVMGIIGSETGDVDDFVNTVRELLALFETYPEGTDIFTLISNKADKASLSDYVSKKGDTMIGALIVSTSGARSEVRGSHISIVTNSSDGNESTTNYTEKGIIISNYGIPSKTLAFPQNKEGTLLVDSDLTWDNIQDVPQSFAPSGPAGGDLTGTYPNPTIGEGKVTEEKIATGAVTQDKIEDHSVSADKIVQHTVTDNELSITGVLAATYSVVTVTTSGRVTAGASLFTIGMADVIPSSVPINAFYLEQVA